jgi:hypothetical protein
MSDAKALSERLRYEPSIGNALRAADMIDAMRESLQARDDALKLCAADNNRLRKRMKAAERALQPALDALDKIDSDPDNFTTRKEAEVQAFYAVQRIRAVLCEFEEK